jgi:hypothetical protein
LVAQALSIGVGGHQCLELTNQLGVLAEAKVNLEALLQRHQAGLLQPSALGVNSQAGRQVRQG